MSIIGQAEQTQTIEAIYENGTFRPIDPLDGSIDEGQHVQLTVRVVTGADGEDPLGMLTNFWDGMSEEEIEEVESIMLDRSNWRSRTATS